MMLSRGFCAGRTTALLLNRNTIYVSARFIHSNTTLNQQQQHKPHEEPQENGEDKKQQLEEQPSSSPVPSSSSSAQQQPVSSSSATKSSGIKPIKIISQYPILRRPPVSAEFPMRETRTVDGFRNAVWSSPEERNLVKRGVILSIIFALTLWLGTYYRAMLVNQAKGMQWFPAMFIYANDPHNLHVEHFFGRFHYSDNRIKHHRSKTYNKEDTIEYLKKINEETPGIVEL